MSTMTLAALETVHGVQVDEHLDRDVTIPVSAGLQRQGDVIVIPTALVGRAVRDATDPVPDAGVPVVRGENGGNTHLLLAAPVAFYTAAPQRSGSLDLGVLSVPAGSTGYLAHPEHGYAGIAPGTYVVRRQREQADIIRLVQD